MQMSNYSSDFNRESLIKNEDRNLLRQLRLFRKIQLMSGRDELLEYIKELEKKYPESHPDIKMRMEFVEIVGKRIDRIEKESTLR